MKPKTIVIPIVAGIGNALMAVPMVRRLKEAMPEARVVIVARTDAMAEPFRRLTEVDEVIANEKGVRNLFRAIRKCRPDIFLVPFPSNRWQYSLLALASGARRKILHGYPRGYWRAMHFIGTRVPAVRGLHDVEQNLQLLRALGIEPGGPQAPVFHLNENDREGAEELLSAQGGSFIAIHAGSATTVLSRAKRWPPAKYAKLIQLLRREIEHSIFLLEGPDERGVAEEILKLVPQPHERINAITLNGPLGVTAALLERAALYVGSDSGLAHLAAAVGTRAVTLFAPADPQRVCPFGNRDLVVQSSNSCAPCFIYPWKSTYPKMKCRQPWCIDGIEAERVMEKVRGVLGLIPSPSGGRVRVRGWIG